jgi:hypothetical protein
MFDFPNTPTNGQQVVGPNGAVLQWNGMLWADVAASQSANVSAGNVGRNLLHNGLFNVQQRGTGPFNLTAGAYTFTADRWRGSLDGGGSQSISIVAQTDSGRATIGDEASTWVLQCTFTGSAAAASDCTMYQAVEGVRRLGGKTVILSFWAWAQSGTPKLGANFYQQFGGGGTPSAVVQVNGQAVTLSTTPTRYSLTFSLPSTNGKILGTDGTDRTSFFLWYSASADQNTASGSVGVQSGTINLWGMQLEIAQAGQTQPTPLEKLDPADDLRHCQRFYCAGLQIATAFYQVAGGAVNASATLPTTMRAAPTMAIVNDYTGNVSGLAVSALGNKGYFLQGTATGSGGTVLNAVVTASADL